jgi:DNA-binding NarL/FixJ family response regulator
MNKKNKPAARGSVKIPPDIDWRDLVAAMDLPLQQAKIVELLLQGMQDKQIAYELGLSRQTVRTYLNRIFARFHVADRVELVIRVFAGYRQCCSHPKCPHKV